MSHMQGPTDLFWTEMTEIAKIGIVDENNHNAQLWTKIGHNWSSDRPCQML